MDTMIENRKRHFVIRINKHDEPIRPVVFVAFLMVACMPINSISIGGFGILLLLGVPLLALCVPTLLNRIQNTLWDKATLFLSAFFIYGLIAYIWSPSFRLYSLYNYIKNIMVVMCLYCLSYNQREKRLLIGGSLVACLMVCFSFLSGKNIGYEEGRATLEIFGVMQDQNYLGFLFIVPLAWCVDQIMHHKSWKVKVGCTAFSLIMLYCVLTTGSRGALVALAAVVMVAVVKKFKTLWAKILFCLVMSLLVVAIFSLILTLLPSEIVARYSWQLLWESRGTGRGDIWLKTIEEIFNSPHHIFLGFGTGSSIAIIGVATHNYILQLLLELGLVGTCLFTGFYWFWLKRLWNSDTMCLSIILGCMALAMTLSVNTIFYFWVALTLGIVCSKAR